MLQELPVHQRGDAVSSIVYEANARRRNPVYGCAGAISYLQNQVSQLQMQLAVAQTEILCIHMQPNQPLALDQEQCVDQNALPPQRGDDSDSLLINPQLMSFQSGSSVGQEPLKGESMWA
ncbi:LOB domain-containing protein 12 [Platanthera guangdongensis]|uniref:LOB domain-containing protein 12 n=1 Tax=Platanthera guangdongensis TaxID=2320717 RepID=A0ABR2LFD9_9ASPA